jgi:hypothetical protein
MESEFLGTGVEMPEGIKKGKSMQEIIQGPAELCLEISSGVQWALYTIEITSHHREVA